MSTTALADGGKAVALAVVLGAVLAFVPVLSIAALPVLPVPVAYITSRHGVVLGLLASLAAGFLCATFAGLFAGLLVMLLADVGVGAGAGLRRGLSILRLFLLVAALFMAALVLWSGVVLASAGVGPVGAIDEMAGQAAVTAGGLYGALGMSQSDVDAAVADFRDFAALLPYLLPALLLVMSIVLSGATVALSRQVFQRLKQPFPAGFEFRQLRLHFGFAYLMIAGLILELVSPYLSSGYAEASRLAGMNILIVSEMLFFIQGIAIASFFMEKYKLARAMRIPVYVALVLIQAVFSLVSWLGLFDTWIDYRRRFGRKKGPGQQIRQ